MNEYYEGFSQQKRLFFKTFELNFLRLKKFLNKKTISKLIETVF